MRFEGYLTQVIHILRKNVNKIYQKIFELEKIIFNIVEGINIPGLTNPSI
jgi:hypothetical protein